MLLFKKSELMPLVKAIPPSCEMLLVHDQGVYIMSMAQPVGQRTIVYAHRCDPTKDKDWWETSRKLVGGDDFGETIGTAGEIITLLEASKHGLKVQVTEDHIITTPH